MAISWNALLLNEGKSNFSNWFDLNWRREPPSIEIARFVRRLSLPFSPTCPSLLHSTIALMTASCTPCFSFSSFIASTSLRLHLDDFTIEYHENFIEPMFSQRAKLPDLFSLSRWFISCLKFAGYCRDHWSSWSLVRGLRISWRRLVKLLIEISELWSIVLIFQCFARSTAGSEQRSSTLCNFAV